MRLKAVILENFRLYRDRIRIELEDLTAFIGKNDHGKSSILEALAIFFDSDVVKISAEDACVYSESKEIRIGCVFDDFPDEIIIDANARTSLKEEYLLNGDGDLEIHKVYDCGKSRISSSVFAIARHPSASQVNDLLLLKQNDLKQRYKTLNLDENSIDMRVNAAIRQAIWGNFSEDALALNDQEIPLDKEDAKRLWDKLSDYLPVFALFQADRSSTDGDAEVQDPMKLAVAEAIRAAAEQLENIKREVEAKAIDVANRTLQKLQEMDPELARELKPNFKAEPKWDGFKLTLTSDDNIPINKRGSGVRRLILLNFFRAEAERKALEEGRNNIIYAIEEPEASQHPSNQGLLINSLIALSETAGCQVLLTTHVPKIAGLLPLNSLRFVSRDDQRNPVVSVGNDDIYKRIVDDLGILSDPLDVQVIVCVEGVNDVNFLHHMSRLLRTRDQTLPDLDNDPRISIIPLGGSNLKNWAVKHYLKNLRIPEFHIYDRDNDEKYRGACDEVNNRNDGSYATLTGKLQMESYLHPDAINSEFSIEITFEDIRAYRDNVPRLVAEKSGRQESEVKKRLNDAVIITPKK